jgi:hypothetical protein
MKNSEADFWRAINAGLRLKNGESLCDYINRIKQWAKANAEVS